MRRIASLFVLIFVLSELSCAGFFKDRIKKRMAEAPPPEETLKVNQKITASGEYVENFEIDGLKRWFKVYVPKSFSSQSKSLLPLLFAFHGGGGDMAIMSKDEYYNFITNADKYNYIVVFANGYSEFDSQKFATWNAGACCGQARDKKINDPAFVKKIIETLSQQINFNHARIFATGMSNGGMLSYKLACEMSDTFKAIAPVAGTDNTLECHPARTISIFHTHAKDDDHVLYNGGLGPKALSKEAETEFKSVPSTIEKWLKLNKCESKPVVNKINDGVTCEEYNNCDQHSANGQIRMKLCTTATGGHSWPGGKKPSSILSTKQPSQAMSATEEIMKFFSELK